MIPPQTAREILDAARIEEVVEEFLTLRRRGANLIGLCPFHAERTPSFSVNPARNIFKCFGCGKGGDAVTFLREHEGFTYPEALRWLANKYRIEIQEVERTPEQVAEQQQAESLFIVNDFAARHFQEQMLNTDEGKSVALSYFRQRGLTDETIQTFGLGHAPDQRDLLLQKARQASHDIGLLQKVGLVSADGTRDFFRARVIFPIHAMSGKIAAFAGRTLSSDKKIPKYINSPESEIYVKSKTLYGMYQAKKAIRKKDECILVEGYMDVISLHQAGIENAVASSGTSLTEGQLLLIRRNTQNLTILYDGDPAGIQAALRGLDLALEQDLNVRVVILPEGEDPDSYVQRVGVQAFEEYIARQAKDVILLKMSLLLGEAEGNPMRRASVVKDMVSSIAKIPDPIRRSAYARECAAQMGIGEQPLMEEVNRLIRADMRKKAEKEARQPGTASDSAEQAPPPSTPWPESEAAPSSPERETSLALPTDEFQERDVIRLLIQFGSRELPGEAITIAEWVLSDIEDLLPEFDNPLYGRIARECHALLLQGQTIEQQYFTQHASPEVVRLALEMLAQPWEYSPNWEIRWNFPLQNQPMPEDNAEADIQQALAMFKIRKINRLLEKNRERLKTAIANGDTKAEMQYLQTNVKIEQARNRIARKHGIVLFPRR
ncbi:MAG: DNA primase [Saprospiraceae bacterium]|nr:DNA primase [Saprospiraceae bacterium]MDW8229068.1 DNA primase [Saprospiraceae bacterium]